jgi:ligand-binding sensor domain-containing protein/two-component sensor histidine kinase
LKIPSSNWKRIIYQAAWALALVIVLSSNENAERLPIKPYTTADGLAHNVVNRIVRDSRGFLWFCTREGLSRFDGYGFTNYGLEQGLPSAIVNDLLETREDIYWVATAGGLCRFDPHGKHRAGISDAREEPNAPAAMFTVYSPNDDARSKYVLSLLQDRAGIVWCGTQNGLYRVEAEGGEVNLAPVELGIPAHFESRFIECLLEDRSGSLWIGTANGLYRRWPDGRVEAYTQRDGLPDNIIQSLLEDREGRIWVGTRFGALFRLVSDPKPGRNVVARAYSDKDGLPARWINQLFQASDGGLWAGSNLGLMQFIPTSDGRDFRFRAYSEVNGLDFREVGALAEDPNGNLWLGTLNGGAAKIARNGFTIFGKADGFSAASSIFHTPGGDLFVFGTPNGKEGFINRFDGEKFLAIRLQVAESIKKREYAWGWGWNQTVVEDHTGEWWVATEGGVCRFPKVSKPEQLAHTPPRAVYTTRDGLAADMILRLFEDSHGDIWIGSFGNGVSLNGLSRWERRTGAFHHYTERDKLPRLDTFYVSSFAEDRAGNLWIGFSGDGGMVRYHNGDFHLFTATDGVPAGQIRNMLIDSAGRLWLISYRGGLSRIDDPSAERPILVTYTVADGLSSNEITAVTEDQWGRIYAGTGRGIDRLDPATGYIKHYTTADGLPLGEMEAALRDRRGALWFSFATGVARLIPQPDPPSLPPPILITSLRIAGQTQPISALGEVEIAPLELGADKNQLQIDFVALGFSSGEGLRYQYKLEGASDEWSHPADERAVNFSNLAPGAYRFLVRATNADGVLSETPASLSFTILPPVWQRWWFISLTAALLGLVAYALYRYRVTRLLQLEQVRTRIAADLHDDIGANLTTIAVLSEVVHQQISGASAMIEAPISSIARLSRESVSSMSDIVWAINPKKDSLRDLTRRMRAFASDIFTSHNIDFEFQPPAADLDLKLGANVRRTVYLIFKEAVNNIARHSACEKARIDIHVEGACLVLKIADDGSGFDAATVTDGNGLQSMRKRAKDSGGEVIISTNPTRGTNVTLRLPAHR